MYPDYQKICADRYLAKDRHLPRESASPLKPVKLTYWHLVVFCVGLLVLGIGYFILGRMVAEAAARGVLNTFLVLLKIVGINLRN